MMQTSLLCVLYAHHAGPVLCSAIGPDDTVYSGGCDNLVKMWHPSSGAAAVTIGQHDAPVKDM